MKERIVDKDGRSLYLWRAWTDDKRIADCGTAWAKSEDAASGIAAMCLGGPHMHLVTRYEISLVGGPADLVVAS